MKKTFFHVVLCMAGYVALGQSNQPSSIQAELTDVANFSARQTGYERFQGYKGATTGSQFYADGWTKGSITSAGNQAINGDYTLLYDKVRQLLFAKPANSDAAGLVAYNKIRSFDIDADGRHHFVTASLYDSTDNSDFYEVLAEGKNATLLKLTSTTFEKADRNTSTGVWQGKLTDAYVDHYTYFVYHNGKLDKVTLKEGSFKKAMKEFSAAINNYAAGHYGEEVNENYYKGMVEAING